MTKNQLKDSAKEFEVHCDDLLVSKLGRAHGRISKRVIKYKRQQTQFKCRKQYTWKWWNTVWPDIDDIFQAEIDLIAELKELVMQRETEKVLSNEELEHCWLIVQTIDLQAQIAKVETAKPWGRDPKDPRVKPILRDLVYQHWVVKCELIERMKKEAWSHDLVEYVQEFLEALDPPLESLAWLRGIFISYAHKDEDKEDLHILLESIESELRDKHYISLWYDQHREKGLVCGDIWFDDLMWQIRNRDLAIVLISKNFFESEFIPKHEVPELCRRREEEELVIFPLILEKADWQNEDWLKDTQYLPSDDETIRANYTSLEAKKSFYAKATKALVHQMEKLST